MLCDVTLACDVFGIGPEFCERGFFGRMFYIVLFAGLQRQKYYFAWKLGIHCLLLHFCDILNSLEQGVALMGCNHIVPLCSCPPPDQPRARSGGGQLPTCITDVERRPTTACKSILAH